MSNRVLVTGATGKLGRAVCGRLVDAGFDVVASDQKHSADFPAPLLLGDLKDEFFVHRAMEGCDSVVHLGNHPNQFAGPSRQRLLSENTAMNANVFGAAVQHGVNTILFASSVQVMLNGVQRGQLPPYRVPYLPIDGKAPPDPRGNGYALSKEFAERMLQLACEENSKLCATVLRFPMLVDDHFARHLLRQRFGSPEQLNFCECLAHLTLKDAAEVTFRSLVKRVEGYRCYFPAVACGLQGFTPAQVVRSFYGDSDCRKPSEEITELIDLSALRAELNWEPEDCLELQHEF